METEDAFKEIDSAQMKTDAEKVRFNKKSDVYKRQAMDSTTKIIELASQNNGIVTAAMISSAGISLSLIHISHKHNLNIIVIGGSGSGKTRFYVKPNALQLIG